MPDTIQIEQGTSQTFQITLKDDNENVVTSYTPTTYTPSFQVWGGQDQSVWSTTPLATFATNGSDGLVNVVFSAATTSGQVAEIYQGRLLLTPNGGGDPVPGWDGFVEVVQSPGTSTPGTTYGSYRDLQTYFPDLGKLQSSADQAGFAEHLAAARAWLDRVILAHDRASSIFFMSGAGYSPASTWGGNLGPAGTNVWLKQQLDANLLIVTSVTKQIVAYRALGTILSSSIGDDGKESPYERHGRNFLQKANALTASYVAELDLNADGYPDYWIDLGTVSQRK